MRYLSVCSGIEAATVAWHPLGWEAAAFSEIASFPRAVLAHHYPHVPLHGDFTTIKGDEYGAVDLLVGGTPCQSFSVAGLRKGLDDPRGNLMLEYGALAKRLRAKWLVWENVPGVLSSNGGRDFAAFLGMLAELGYGFAYRVLDAQYFGVAQRRRRVFVVGCFGDWRSAAAVLFERHSLSGHSAPSRQAGQAAAYGFAGGAIDGIGKPLGAHALINGRGTDLDSTTYILGGIDYEFNGHEATAPTGPLLKGSPTGGGHPLPAVALSVALRGRDGGATAELGDEVATCLRASTGGGDKPHVLTPAYAIQAGALRQNPHSGPDGVGVQQHIAYTLEARAEVQAVQHRMQVRRLTPRECERLQGFPDDYTQVLVRGKPAADGPRYKALGNSMAVPVMAWIGKRIGRVEAILGQQRAAA